MENKIILETFDVLFAVRNTSIQNNEPRKNFSHAKKLSIIVFFAISPESD